MQSKSLENNGLASRKSRKYQRTRPRVGTPKSSIARRNRSSRSPKHIGDLAELEFLLQAASRGFPVGKPFGDNEPYDCLGRRPHPYLAGAGKDRNPLPQSDLLPPQPLERSQAPRFLYPADIDFLAGYIRRHQVWYLIPATAIQGRLTLNLYPCGARRSAGRFEKYREAWHLLNPKSARLIRTVR